MTRSHRAVIDSGKCFFSAMQTMKHEYRVAYYPIEDGWIMAVAPELPGVVTQGKDIEEARAKIKEAIELLLESFRENAAKDAPGDAIWETISIESSVS